MQLVLHSCPGSGVFVFTDCGMHESGDSHDMPECCKKKLPVKKQKQDCGNCEDYFVFSITPKFGSVTNTEAGEPPLAALEKHTSYLIEPSELYSCSFIENRKELPPKLRHYQAIYCAWLI